MSAASVHENGGGSTVKSGKDRRAENLRKKQIKRDQKQRKKEGVVTPTGRSNDQAILEYDSDTGPGSNRKKSSGRSGGGRSSSRSGGARSGGGGGGRRPQVSNSPIGSPGGIGQIFTCISAISIFIVGIFVIADYLDALDVCDDDTDGVECYMSEWLFWEIDGIDETSNSLNAHWRSVFTLNPVFFFDVWLPLIVGLLSVLQMIRGTEWSLISGNWVRTMLWHIFAALFACFGYAGQVGLVVGTIVSVTAIVCFFGAALRWGGRPYLTFSCG